MNIKKLFSRYLDLSNDINNIKVLKTNIENYIKTVNEYFFCRNPKLMVAKGFIAICNFLRTIKVLNLLVYYSMFVFYFYFANYDYN